MEVSSIHSEGLSIPLIKATVYSRSWKLVKLKGGDLKSYVCVGPGVVGLIMAGDEDGNHVCILLLHTNALQH